MSFSPRKTRNATGAIRNRAIPAAAARPTKKGRVISLSKVNSNISPVQRLHDLLTDALNTAKSLEMTPDNHVALQDVRQIAVSLLDILPGDKRAVRDLKYELHGISLTSLSNELATSEKYDPEDRHDKQGPLMDRIMKELAMAEENADMDLIRRCLNLYVYNQSHYVVDYMAWMWREFFVFSAIRGCPVSPSQAIKDDELYEQVFHHLFTLYTKLVSDYPDRLFLDKPFIRYSDAAEILAVVSQTEDIVLLLDCLTKKNFYPSHPSHPHLSDKKLRTRALEVVEKGLKTSKQDTLDAVNHLFPGLGDAQLWLCRLRDAGDFPFDDDILHDKYKERDANLCNFVELKKPEIQREFDVDDEDDYLEEVPQLSERDLERSIQDWAQVLSEWPDQKAAAEMRNRVRFDGSEFLLSSVEGAEEALMDCIQKAEAVQIEKWRQANPPAPLPPPRPKSQPRPRFWGIPAPSYRSYYDYDKSPSRVYSYVTDGLQALIKTFACQDHRSLCK
ncbi:uncharacterized protein EV420DRAFT_1508757 [Desarmillaria tabescens]|uniref:Uncharacterized protein n=1 Tax=Armillaria tabescens TaxID=1929756 RepID=A0AA39TPC0_ARMTA|nr:uncharacterized protein EV420DRAFT_1508757 [Desarmillaria tabescens]KAK0465912.1 hypothetical protein EV420DRAFT_1508757 [Desarmillaria tabescens]